MIYVVFVSIIMLLLVFVFYHAQFFMIFSPTHYREEELDEEFEMLSIITDDGVELEGVVYEPCDLYRKLPTIHSTLLFFGGRKHDTVGLIKKLSLNYPHTRIVTFNYRSYGNSQGKLNEKNILSDGLKVAEVVKKNYGDFYLLGFSIGSSVAAFVASKIEVKGLFLVGSFDSIASLAKERYGKNILWLLKYKFDNTKFVQNIDAKTHLFVSTHDEVTHIKNARKLKEHVKNLALYKEFEELSHAELLWHKEVVDEINRIIS